MQAVMAAAISSASPMRFNGVDENIEPAIAVLDAGAEREQCRTIRYVGHEGGVPVAGQPLHDLAGFSGLIGAWHVGNCDGGAGFGQHAAGGSADGACSANDQRDIACERFGIGDGRHGLQYRGRYFFLAIDNHAIETGQLWSGFHNCPPAVGTPGPSARWAMALASFSTIFGGTNACRQRRRKGATFDMDIDQKRLLYFVIGKTLSPASL